MNEIMLHGEAFNYHANRDRFVDYVRKMLPDQDLVLALIQLENLPIFEESLNEHQGANFRLQVLQQLRHCNPSASINFISTQVIAIAVASSSDNLTVLSSIHGCLGEVNARLDSEIDTYIEPIIGMLKVSHKDHELMGPVLKKLNMTLNRAIREQKDAVYTEDLSRESGIRSTLSFYKDSLQDFNQFWLEYQPIRSCSTNSIFSYEALIRWKSPVFGVLFPGAFLPIAENLQLSKWIDRWSIKEALSEYRVIRTYNECPISVNISEQVIMSDPEFFQFLSQVIDKYEVPPGKLIFEISESTFSRTSKALDSFCKELQRLKISIAIDDFGAKFSNFARLQEIPFNFLKIDRSFLESLTTPKTQQILGSIHEISTANGAKLIAEGVETIETLTILNSLNVEYYQGWLGGYPESLEFNRFGK